MPIIKIRGRREPIEVDYDRANKIKTLRFGGINGLGKADPKDDLVIGEEWAGTIGLVEWVELGKSVQKPQYKFIRFEGQKDNVVHQVPINYQLKEGEQFA